MRNFWDSICRENQNIVYSQYLFLVENREIMWINEVVRQATDDNIVRYMLIVCWITKATDTLRICNIYCFCMATNITQSRQNIIFVLALPVLLLLRKHKYRQPLRSDLLICNVAVWE